MLGHTFRTDICIPVGIYNCTMQHIQILLSRMVCVKLLLNPVKPHIQKFLLYYHQNTYLQPLNIANTICYRQLTCPVKFQNPLGPQKHAHFKVLGFLNTYPSVVTQIPWSPCLLPSVIVLHISHTQHILMTCTILFTLSQHHRSETARTVVCKQIVNIG